MSNGIMRTASCALISEISFVLFVWERGVSMDSGLDDQVCAMGEIDV